MASRKLRYWRNTQTMKSAAAPLGYTNGQAAETFGYIVMKPSRREDPSGESRKVTAKGEWLRLGTPPGNE